ncbi:MAG: hypothetical protein HYV63_01260 [Candidatus Schekmanbacteria bacterium]|nr:hypothetical protein [Candidatus Schekmanbacteria bacterium]
MAEPARWIVGDPVDVRTPEGARQVSEHALLEAPGSPAVVIAAPGLRDPAAVAASAVERGARTLFLMPVGLTLEALDGLRARFGNLGTRLGAVDPLGAHPVAALMRRSLDRWDVGQLQHVRLASHGPGDGCAQGREALWAHPCLDGAALLAGWFGEVLAARALARRTGAGGAALVEALRFRRPGCVGVREITVTFSAATASAASGWRHALEVTGTDGVALAELGTWRPPNAAPLRLRVGAELRIPELTGEAAGYGPRELYDLGLRRGIAAALAGLARGEGELQLRAAAAENHRRSELAAMLATPREHSSC